MEYNKEEKNTIKRGVKKASYNKEVIHSILDATEICNVAFNINGKAFVQPINFGRHEGKLYLHGSLKNRMTNALIEAKEVCLSVMLLDGMKLTRSAFNHSVNYRSVVVFGNVRELHDNKEKILALKSIINHFVPNRWAHCRPPSEKELKATKVIEIEIETASAKVANTPAEDKVDDYKLDYWYGIIPVKTIYEFPIPDERLKDGMEVPKHVLDFIDSRK